MWSLFRTTARYSRRSSQRRGAKRLTSCDRLEDRRMLAITAEFAAGVLTFTGRQRRQRADDHRRGSDQHERRF